MKHRHPTPHKPSRPRNHSCPFAKSVVQNPSTPLRSHPSPIQPLPTLPISNPLHPPHHPLGPKGQPIPAWGIAPGQSPTKTPSPERAPYPFNGHHQRRTDFPVRFPRTQNPHPRPPSTKTRRYPSRRPFNAPAMSRTRTPAPGGHFAVQCGALWVTADRRTHPRKTHQATPAKPKTPQSPNPSSSPISGTPCRLHSIPQSPPPSLRPAA